MDGDRKWRQRILDDVSVGSDRRNADYANLINVSNIKSGLVPLFSYVINLLDSYKIARTLTFRQSN